MKGNRRVYSAYAELNAPIIDQVEINASGRYDRYSGGIDNFSPKIGVKVKPIRQVLLRGTYSKGFRIPSFGEANATFPTTGYVGNGATLFNDTYLAQYGCTVATFSSCPQYIRSGTYGVCELTGNAIEAERLTAIPWTRFSAEAQRELEATGSVARTKLGERGGWVEPSKSDEGGDEEAEAA